MKFSEALEKITTAGITRNNWPYHLKYCHDGYLTLCDFRGEISPYTIHEHDFIYDWKFTNE